MSDAASDDDETGGQGRDQDWDWDDDEASTFCATRDVLYHEKEHESTTACLNHCCNQYGWDLLALAKSLNLDIYGSIRLVNWLRRQVAQKRKDLEDDALIEYLKEPFKAGDRPALLDDDELLFPYLPDDPLLPALSSELNEDMGEGDAMQVAGEGGLESMETLQRENLRLREELKLQKELIEAAKVSVLAGDGDTDDDDGDDAPMADGAAAAAKEAERGVRRAEKGMKRSEKSYFDSYSKIGIHQEMLSDRTRTESYRDFLLRNPSLIKDKVVLDVGCGTGILCLFAAKAGAKLVIGIDMSDIIEDAREIVRANGLEDKIVLIKGKVEEVELPVTEVDVVVSEWMGYFLLYESMLDSVIYARDRYLKPGGVCMPDKCVMYLAAIDDAPRLDFWDNVYGFDMSTIKQKVRSRCLRDPMVEHYEQKQLLTDCTILKELDCQKLAVSELEFKAPFKVVAEVDGQCDALLSYFDVHFMTGCDNPVTFTTGPFGIPDDQTHWKQTTFYLEEGPRLRKGDAMEGEIDCRRARHNPRHLDITITWTHVPLNGPRGKTHYENYQLA